MKLGFLALAFVGMLNARAEVAVGTYVPGVSRYQIDKGGSVNKFEFAPMLSLNHYFHLMGPLYFAPEVGAVWHLNTNGEYYKYTAFFLYGFGFRLLNPLVLRFGAGTFYTRVGGAGGTVTRDNGSGTASFYSPSISHTSYNFTPSLGLELYIFKGSSLRAETYVFDLSSKARRSFSYALSYNHHF